MLVWDRDRPADAPHGPWLCEVEPFDWPHHPHGCADISLA
jgi:hypothetical protein